MMASCTTLLKSDGMIHVPRQSFISVPSFTTFWCSNVRQNDPIKLVSRNNVNMRNVFLLG